MVGHGSAAAGPRVDTVWRRVLVVVGYTVLVWKAPAWVDRDSWRLLTPEQRLEEADRVRSRMLQLGAGLAASVALVYTGLRHRLDRRAHDLAEQGQVTGRFTAAIEQLGSATLAVRLGGIYALERIMRDSAPDQPTIVEVLAAQVPRTESAGAVFAAASPGEQGTVPASGPAEQRRPPPDAVAVMTVLARRPARYTHYFIDLRRADLEGLELPGHARLGRARLAGANLRSAQLTFADLNEADLRGADLSGANLFNAELRGVGLGGADLTSADLTGAKVHGNLRGANLTGANLTGASLVSVKIGDHPQSGANLADANLTGADLRGADLAKVDLTGANLSGATLDGTNLRGAKLSEATGLLAEQLASAGLAQTVLEPDLAADPWVIARINDCSAWAADGYRYLIPGPTPAPTA
jgi:uncharacterized protein YjbI with pentapeptide repeats